MKQLIVVLIPTYQEAETLEALVRRIPRLVGSRRTTIVISDDCSPDGTAEIAKRLTPHVITSAKNTGVGANTLRAFAYIAQMHDVEYVIKLDGDGQHDTELIPDVVRALDKGADIVTCSRFHPEAVHVVTPLLDRILLNGIFADSMSHVTGWEITDARTGYMGLRWSDVRMLARRMIVERYGIPMEILLRIWRNNPKAVLKELPHPARYESGISARLDAKYATETIQEKSTRLEVAYQAMLAVLEDLDVSSEELMVSRKAGKIGAVYHRPAFAGQDASLENRRFSSY